MQLPARRPSPLPAPSPARLASVCVFGGGSRGADPALLAAAAVVGTALAAAGIGLVYGGGRHGLTGALALGAASAGGRVVAVVPDFIAARRAGAALAHDVVAVDGMESRMRVLSERADAFVALPGGIGTLAELAEVIARHAPAPQRKPILIGNFGGFWRTPVMALFEHLGRSGSRREDVLRDCRVADRPERVVPLLQAAAGMAAGTTGRRRRSCRAPSSASGRRPCGRP